MMRRAPSASSACTAMPISPSVLTTIGNSDCGRCDVTTDGTPCASRRPRTTLASTSDRVRNTVTRSATVTRFNVELAAYHSSLFCELCELGVDGCHRGLRQLLNLQQ